MGIIADIFHQAGAQRVGDDVARGLPPILLFAHCVVTKCFQPQSTLEVQLGLYSVSGAQLEAFNDRRQGGNFAQLQRPTYMIRQEEPAQGLDRGAVVQCADICHRTTGAEKIDGVTLQPFRQ